MEIGHIVYICGMGQSMMGAPQPNTTVRRTKRLEDNYKMTRLRLTTEARVWMEVLRKETLIPLQCDRWKRTLLKKARNSDIAYWLEHNRISRRCVQKGEVVTNILMRMMPQEELKQADNSFFAKIIRAKRMIM